MPIDPVGLSTPAASVCELPLVIPAFKEAGVFGDAAAEPEPLFVFDSTGFYPPESAGGERSRRSGRVGQIDFPDLSGRPRTVRFSMMLRTGHAEAAPSQVGVAGKVGRLMVSSTGAGYTRTMTLPAKSDMRMMLRAGCEPVDTEPSDVRIGLYFRTVNPTLRELQ